MSLGLGAGVAGRVSVVVPAYNYAHFLPHCLASVFGQACADLEVIVVDDGSSDDTAAVVAREPRARYLHQANAGLSAARNTGLVASSGEFLLFLDADDLLAPRTLAARVAFLAARPTAGVAVCRNRQFIDTMPDGQPRPGPPWYLPPRDLAPRLLHFNLAPPHAWLLRRHVADAVGLFDTGLRACEDHDYWLRALVAGHAPLYSPVGEVFYRKHPASMSADHTRQWQHDAILHERILDALARHGDLGLGRAAWLAAWSGACQTLARLADRLPNEHGRLLTRLEAAVDELPRVTPHVAGANALLLQHYARLLARAAREASAPPRARACAHAALAALGGVAGDLSTVLSLVTPGAAPLVDRWRLARLLLS